MALLTWPPLCVSSGLPPLIAFDIADFWKSYWRDSLSDTLPGHGSQRNVGLAWCGKERSSYLAKSFCLGNENKHSLLIVIREVHALLLNDLKDFFSTLKLQKHKPPHFFILHFCSKKVFINWMTEIAFGVFLSSSGSDGWNEINWCGRGRKLLEGNWIMEALRVTHVKKDLFPPRVQKHLRYRRSWGTYRCTCSGIKEAELCLP